MIVVALHGFFGHPDDWKSVAENIVEDLDVEFLTPDLAIWATRAGVNDFESFSAAFNRYVRAFVESRNQPVVLVGYSLGARLAAACILDEPDLYRAGLFISMNPGLPASDISLRKERVAVDAIWSEKMRRENWEIIWQAWNEQNVLKPGSRFANKMANLNSIESRRIEGRREAWARAMDIWTLGLQQDLRSDLEEWIQDEEGRRLTLMTGTDDSKFTEITNNWLQRSTAPDLIRHRRVLGAGHRVLAESPEDVAAELKMLLNGL